MVKPKARTAEDGLAPLHTGHVEAPACYGGGSKRVERSIDFEIDEGWGDVWLHGGDTVVDPFISEELRGNSVEKSSSVFKNLFSIEL